MANLAILGHPTRGKEVIQLLEMLGGVNVFNLDGTMNNYYYYIDKNSNKIYHCLSINLEYGIVYTLEEFEEKFPYKVGDKVIYEDKIREITKMVWEEQTNTIAYKFDNKLYCNVIDDLQPYKEETMKEIKSIDLNKLEQQLDEALAKETPESLNKWLDGEPDEPKAPILSNRYDYAEGKCGYVIPDGYEFDSIKQGFQTEIIIRPIKPQYPKTYKECCSVLGIEDDLQFVYENIDGRHINPACISHYRMRKLNLYDNFEDLITCRDAYWKIAGEQMGLDKPWKPDFTNIDNCYSAIKTCKGEISLIPTLYIEDCILAFPTKEMRDAFYENFKDLINDCKELL